MFTGGIQSTSRTKGYNAVLKKQITSSATLCDLAKILDGRSKTEQLQEQYKQWQISTSSYQAPFVPTHLFSNVYELLKQYVSSFYFQQTEQQMAEAMLYHAEKTTMESALQVCY